MKKTSYKTHRAYPTKYARDSLAKKTLGEMVDGVKSLIDSGASDDQLADYLDKEFIMGAWGDVCKTLPELFLRDIRGFIVAMYRKDKNEKA